jgi:hypothetical protein
MSKYPKGLLHISEEEKLKIRLKSTYEERFFQLLKLIAIQKLLKDAIIINKPKNKI